MFLFIYFCCQCTQWQIIVTVDDQKNNPKPDSDYSFFLLRMCNVIIYGCSGRVVDFWAKKEHPFMCLLTSLSSSLSSSAANRISIRILSDNFDFLYNGCMSLRSFDAYSTSVRVFFAFICNQHAHTWRKTNTLSHGERNEERERERESEDHQVEGERLIRNASLV